MLECLLQVNKTHVDWSGKLDQSTVHRANSYEPSSTLRVGYRACPVFHGQDENRIVRPESEVRLLAEFSSPVPWNRLSQGG